MTQVIQMRPIGIDPRPTVLSDNEHQIAVIMRTL